MTPKRILGLVMLIGAVAMMFASYYIKNRVAEGKEQITSAQQKVDQTNSLFSLNPISKEIGHGVTGSAQQQINEGKEQAGQYATLASWLQIGGIVAAVLGIGLIFFGGRKRA